MMRYFNFLLCYDICDAKRLQKLQRLVSKSMLQIQYSVYYATLTKKQADELIVQIKKIIHDKDNICLYEVEPIENSFIQGKRSTQVMLFSKEGKRIYW